MKAIYQILLTGIVLLLCGTCGYAMPYRFDNMHIDGTSAIYSFAQDKSGIIWLGTENGLYSYDGYHFYPHFERKDRSNSRVHTLCMHDELLYVGTENGLLTYNIHTGRYRKKQQQTA